MTSTRYSDEGKKAASADPPAVAAAAVLTEVEKNKDTVDVLTAAAEAGDDTSSGGGLRLSPEYVECILSLKPLFVVDPDEEHARMTNHPGKIYSQEFIDESVEIFRDLAESSKRIFGRFEKLQAWMRGQLEEKGCVEVDDEYIARRVMARQQIEEEEEAETEMHELVDALGAMEK
ncbi:unnamed protein product [Urochloa humidicola]